MQFAVQLATGIAPAIHANPDMLKIIIAVSLIRNGAAIKVLPPVQPTTGEATAALPGV